MGGHPYAAAGGEISVRVLVVLEVSGGTHLGGDQLMLHLDDEGNLLV